MAKDNSGREFLLACPECGASESEALRLRDRVCKICGWNEQGLDPRMVRAKTGLRCCEENLTHAGIDEWVDDDEDIRGTCKYCDSNVYFSEDYHSPLRIERHFSSLQEKWGTPKEDRFMTGKWRCINSQDSDTCP